MSLLRRAVSSFSSVGLIVGLALFCASLTPSLLPRTAFVQGVLSGVVFALGYGLGFVAHGLWRFMELRDVPTRFSRVLNWLLVGLLVLTAVYTLRQVMTWQNSVRLRMDMEPIPSGYPLTVLGVAVVTALVVILVARLGLFVAGKIVGLLARFVPHRVAIVLGGAAFLVLTTFLVNGVILRAAVQGMDETFAKMDRLMDEDYDPPADAWASGSASSLIAWDEIGRNGKRYIMEGPRQAEIESVLGREAMQPLRVYAGFRTGETLEERARIALAELKRIGAFDRSTLIVATSTGTGWMDPSAVNPVEYLHAGDVATVTMQYSYLPSWLTLMVKPTSAVDAATALFKAVYGYWSTRPEDARPALYLFGLSLGALGSARSADMITMFEDPVQGALWAGPPFPSRQWRAITRHRQPGSPAWRPIFRDSRLVRVMTQDGMGDLGDAAWGPLRIVYLQHASDPMTFFSPDLAYKAPAWLGAERGRDVSPYLRWTPLVTMFQVGFDVPMATSVPLGYGHNFAANEYIDAWIDVTQPKNWSEADTRKVKEHFIGFEPSPL